MVSLSSSDLFNTNYSVRTAALHNQTTDARGATAVNKPILLHRIVNINTYSSSWQYTVKKMYRIPVFFLPNFSETGKPLCWQGIFWCPPEKEFFVFWGGKSIPLSAGVIFSSLLNVIFPYFPYFPIKFTGKLLEDSWLATGAPGRVAIKFGRWEKNSAPFVKLQVWNSVKFLVN